MRLVNGFSSAALSQHESCCQADPFGAQTNRPDQSTVARVIRGRDIPTWAFLLSPTQPATKTPNIIYLARLTLPVRTNKCTRPVQISQPTHGSFSAGTFRGRHFLPTYPATKTRNMIYLGWVTLPVRTRSVQISQSSHFSLSVGTFRPEFQCLLKISLFGRPLSREYGTYKTVKATGVGIFSVLILDQLHTRCEQNLPGLLNTFRSLCGSFLRTAFCSRCRSFLRTF